MAAKKKSTKKPTKPKKTVRKKAALTKAKKRSKKVTTKNAAPKRAPTKTAQKKRAPTKKAAAKKQSRKKSARVQELAYPSERRASSMDEQSGDLQGLSRHESADSESVDELIEEGNAFEADVVAGVERADDADEQEVRTHEVPEDDVPGEYLDKE
jgi:RNA polymerase primary sigma factor